MTEPAPTLAETLDVLDLFIAYEEGNLDEADTIALFQRLVNTGVIDHLQGRYRRAARDLIEQGKVKLPPPR